MIPHTKEEQAAHKIFTALDGHVKMGIHYQSNGVTVYDSTTSNHYVVADSKGLRAISRL